MLIGVNAKCRHLQKLTSKGTLRQVFIRVYRLELANFLRTFSHVGIFDQAVWSGLSPVAPLPFSLVQLSTPSPGYGGVLGFTQIKKTCCKVPLQVNFFRWRHFALPSMSLIFVRCLQKTYYSDCKPKYINIFATASIFTLGFWHCNKEFFHFYR
jgi:hypothetical protein